MNQYICTNCKKEITRYPSTVRNSNRVFCSQDCLANYQKQELIGENNPNFDKGRWCQSNKCECGRIKDCRASQCAICAKKSFPTNGMLRFTQQEFIDAVKQSTSVLEVAQKLKTSRQTVSSEIEKYSLSIDHFRPGRGRPISLEDYLIEGDCKRNGTIKKRLIEDRVIEEKCSICGVNHEWLNKPLTLELHHVNGNAMDNRIENLCLLCPNCHSQTSNNKGKNSTGIKKGKRKNGAK